MNELPETEILWETIKTLKGRTFYITSERFRNCYYIYEQKKRKIVKLGEDVSPKILKDKFALSSKNS